MSSTPGSSTANSLPLGYACLAISVLALSYVMYAPQSTASAVPTLLFVGGLGMLIAGIAALSRGDGFNSTWLVGYGVMWATTALYMWLFGSKATSPASDIAWWAASWGIFSALVFIVSLKTKRMIASLTLLLFFITFLCTWIAHAFGAASFNQIAAIAAIITAILAAIEGYTQLSNTV